jgi:hypothetical protein
MKGADFPPSATVSTAPSNGTHRPAKGQTGSRRKARADADTRAVPELPSAPFRTMEPGPVDAPMWPIHPAAWLQPERAPSAPGWSDLAAERQHRIPAPGFAIAAVRPLDRAAAAEHPDQAMPPRPVTGIPESGLGTLGWDPRAESRREKPE